MWVTNTRKRNAICTIVTACVIMAIRVVVARRESSTCAFTNTNVRCPLIGRSLFGEEGVASRRQQLQRQQRQRQGEGVSRSASDSSAADDITTKGQKIRNNNNNNNKKGKRSGTTKNNGPKPPRNTDPTQTPQTQSWNLYFSNPSIRRKYSGASAPSITAPTPPTQWRTQAKLTASRVSTFGNRGCSFGLHLPRRTSAVPIPDPSVHHPAITRAIEVLEEATENVATSAFLPDTGQGGLRYVQLQVERTSARVCLVLVWNADGLKRCQPGLTRLVKEVRRIEPDLWSNVWLHTNDSLGSSMFARGEQRWHRLVGPEYFRELLPGHQHASHGLLHYTPMVFRHPNLDGYEAIARKVADAIPDGSKVCELYAGVGILGLTALTHKSLQWLRCSDDNAPSKRCFIRAINSMPTEVTGIPPRSKNKKNKPYNKHKNKRHNSHNDDDIPLEELMQLMKDDYSPSSKKQTKNNKSDDKVTYLVASAAKALQAGQALGADVLCVDPPRKGLDDTVLEQLCRPYNPNQNYAEDLETLLSFSAPRNTINYVNDVRTLVYVSCGFDSLARDCDRLLKGDAGWKLESATGYVLFPGSNHVQTLAVFVR